MSRIAFALLAGFAVLTLGAPASATLNACAAAKKVCVAKKAAAILKCHGKNEKPPNGLTPAKFAACVQKAKDHFDGGSMPANGCFAKLEARYPGGCLTISDTATIETDVDAFVDAMVCKLDPGAGTCPATPTPTPTRTPTPEPTPTGCNTTGQPCTSDPICCSHACNILLGVCN